MPVPTRRLARLLVLLCLVGLPASSAVALTGCNDDVQVNEQDDGAGDGQSPGEGGDVDDEDPGDER
jgi:hypothetical protein